MTTRSIFDLFGTSPFRPIQQHMELVYGAVSELVLFFDHALKNDWETAEAIREKIKKLDNDADTIKYDLRLNLPKSLMLPVSRGNIFELLSRQDKLASKTKDITGVVIGRRMTFPDAIKDLFMHFLQRNIDAAYQAHKTIEELDKLYEAGFKGKEIQIVSGMVNILHDIEQESDTIQINVRRLLFDIEKTLNPIDVIFIYKIIEWTGDISNIAQAIGDRMLIMVLR